MRTRAGYDPPKGKEWWSWGFGRRCRARVPLYELYVCSICLVDRRSETPSADRGGVEFQPSTQRVSRGSWLCDKMHCVCVVWSVPVEVSGALVEGVVCRRQGRAERRRSHVAIALLREG